MFSIEEEKSLRKILDQNLDLYYMAIRGDEKLFNSLKDNEIFNEQGFYKKIYGGPLFLEEVSFIGYIKEIFDQLFIIE
jgi:hypothetical protein